MAPAAATSGAVSGVTPPSISMSIGRLADERLDRRDLIDHRRDERLTAETGIDRHQEDEVEPVEHVFDGVDGRRGIERHAGLLAERPDSLQRAVEMRPGFGVDGDDVGAGFGEGGEVGVGRRDHQVAVEALLRGGRGSP